MELLFNYGSNHPGQLTDRIGPPKRMFAAYAPGYMRVFRGWSNGWGGGVASLKAGKRRPAYGYVAEITKAQLERMDKFEGVASGNYSRKKIKVIIDSEPVTVWAYVSNSTEFNEPSQRYLDAIVKTISTFWEIDGPDDITVEDDTVRRNPSNTRRNPAKDGLAEARGLRRVMAERSGDDDWMKVPAEEFLMFDSADEIEEQNYEPRHFIDIDGISSVEEWMQEVVPVFVKHYIVEAGAVKVCSIMSPAFAYEARKAGFDCYVVREPGHVKNVFKFDGCYLEVDLTAAQFEVCRIAEEIAAKDEEERPSDPYGERRAVRRLVKRAEEAPFSMVQMKVFKTYNKRLELPEINEKQHVSLDRLMKLYSD